jgi:LuxR family maltose regulon positive regulatory protein
MAVAFMDNFVLATKLRIPPQPQHAVHRARLIDTLEGGIQQYKLTVISAPAGYGKTTLLSQWAHATELPVVWLSISEDDNDLERFLRYLLAGWEALQPDIQESSLGQLLGASMPDMEAVLAAFINVANDVSEHIVFILDDYHLIEDDSIQQALTFLLDHLPPNLHFVLACRAAPPLALARYRARHKLLELRADDLTFLLDETSDFLIERMGLELPPNEVERLQSQLEGWITGLQLVALTVRRNLTDVARLDISGKHRFIADYLSEDVLAHLPAALQTFLLQTSILDRLCGPLCDAVTGRDDGQAMLETLEQENLFLVALDDNREWFRYHHLFADFLQEALKRRHPDEIVNLHRQAGRWYLAQNLPEQAFHHAVAGDYVELVVQIFDLYMTAKLNSGEIRVIERWLNAIPAEWYAAYPVLELGRVGFLAYTGAFEACMRCIDDIEQRLMPVDSEAKHWQLTRVIAVRCLMACMRNDLGQAEDYARQALQNLPETDASFRPGIYVALGDTYRVSGNWTEAKTCYLKALSVADSPQHGFMSAHVFGALADLVLRQGQLREADDYWRKALAVIQEQENWGRIELPVIGWVYMRLGETLYERNELAEAWDRVSSGLERAELGGDVRALIAGYLIAGRLKLTEGDIEAATAYLQKTRPLVESAQFSHWISRFERFQLELWLAQDRLRTAVDWSDQRLRDAAIEERPESEVTQLAIARVLIIKGDRPSVERAQSLLERLLQTAEAEGRTGVTIEALTLQALGNWRLGDRTGAMTSLERALRLAEPEGYVRLFADLGLPMARLLQEARSRNVMPDYVDTLLDAFGDDTALPDQDGGALPEPLTPREQEILELVAAGLTNREIADTLVISPETVKKHTGTIYGKLGVGNRTEAAARARELDLLK